MVEVLLDVDMIQNYLSYNHKATIGGHLKKLSMHGDIVGCAMAIVTN